MKKYKGFSLIEVMMLFAALTIILAISAPLMTKRAKDVPTRLPHGFYQCYRDNAGVLHEEWYNSFRQISSKTVSECKFTPPENVTMYKITLIGAGTGGVAYANVKYAWDTYTSSYDMGDGYDGRNLMLRDLTVEEISKIFGGQSYTLCNGPAPNAGNGQSEYRRFFTTNKVYCTGEGTKCNSACTEPYENDEKYKDNSAQYEADLSTYNACVNCVDDNNAALKEYQSKHLDVSKCAADLNKICQALGYQKVANKLRSPTQTYNETVYGFGGDGGKGLYARRDYKIAEYNNRSLSDYESYLKAVDKSYSNAVKANCSYGNTKMCNQGNYSAGSNASPDIRYTDGNGNILYNGKKVDSGENASGGVGIYWTHPVTGAGSWTTTFFPATGGISGFVKGDGKEIAYYGVNGSDGSNSGGDSSCCEYKPYGQIYTKWMVKYYTLGTYGNPGNVATYTTHDLGTKQCKIYIGKGSTYHNINETRNYTEAQANVNTVLSCAGLTFTAKGGVETNTTEQLEKYVPNGGGIHTAVFPESKKPANPEYKYPNVWLKHIAKPSVTFGEAGDSSTLYDKCTNAIGYMEYGTNYTGSCNKTYVKKGETEKFGTECTEDDYSGRSDRHDSNVYAGNGGPGAIFIRW